jgi:hypothetical protein
VFMARQKKKYTARNKCTSIPRAGGAVRHSPRCNGMQFQSECSTFHRHRGISSVLLLEVRGLYGQDIELYGRERTKRGSNPHISLMKL